MDADIAQNAASFDVVPLKLAIRSMRDNGYKNAAYAIAELVDNSVQAKASLIEIICKEEEEFIRQRRRSRVHEIAVVDNGEGMDSRILRRALQFGVGERLKDRSGIGRFGMGLPNSSISQARRVDVWSWQEGGSSNAIHTYLDLDDIEADILREIPVPTKKNIPEEWKRISSSIAKSNSGTVVVWSKLDKCDWRTAHAIFRNSEYTIGRVYRRFLENGRVKIRMASYNSDEISPDFDEYAKPNDPMYLMEDTSCPAPWASSPMFEAYGEPHLILVTKDGKKHIISIRYSVAKKEARSSPQAGSEPWGKHASNNIGVSIVRADRELELQSGWCIGYDPRERWWGAEVDFPAALDEVFGVPNNKQSAPALAEFAILGLDQLAKREGFESEQELIEAWSEDDDPRIALVRVKQSIESNLNTLRRSIKAQAERSSGRKRYADPESAEVRGTKATETRKEDGNVGSSDADELLPSMQKEIEIARDLIGQGIEESEATERAKNLVSDGRKYEFFEVDLTTPEFFNVRTKAGAILIGLNTNHPAYEHLVSLLKHDPEGDNAEVTKDLLRKSFEGLKLLLEAWARYEDELTDGKKKEQAQMARLDWGRVARDFFREE